MNHLWGNYNKMVAPIHSNAKVYVIRQESVWDDWTAINKLLAPNRTVVLPTGEAAHGRDTAKLNQPITRDLSNKGREHLCRAIEQEYELFFSLLNRAVNLNATDIQEAREKAQRNCPNLVKPHVPLNTTNPRENDLTESSRAGVGRGMKAATRLNKGGRDHVAGNGTVFHMNSSLNNSG